MANTEKKPEDCINYCSCTQFCWVPKCLKHQGELEQPERTRVVDFRSGRNQDTAPNRAAVSETTRLDNLIERVKALGTSTERATGVRHRLPSMSVSHAGCSLPLHPTTPWADNVNEQEATRSESREVVLQDQPYISAINTQYARRTAVDHSQANFTHVAAHRTLYTRFAPLPTEHNTGSRELLLSRQRTPYMAGPYVRGDPTVEPARWSSPSGKKQVCERAGHWIHLGTSSLRDCIIQRRIWLKRCFGKSPSTVEKVMDEVDAQPLERD